MKNRLYISCHILRVYQEEEQILHSINLIFFGMFSLSILIA
jgi:hypothetical protein